MSSNWRQMYISPDSENSDPKILDDHLIQELAVSELPPPVFVCHQNVDGQYMHRPEEDGLYEVRLLVDFEFWHKEAWRIIEEHGFTVVREVINDNNGVVETIEHQSPEGSDFPGRRK